jgi:hypothetical protein
MNTNAANAAASRVLSRSRSTSAESTLPLRAGAFYTPRMRKRPTRHHGQALGGESPTRADRDRGDNSWATARTADQARPRLTRCLQPKDAPSTPPRTDCSTGRRIARRHRASRKRAAHSACLSGRTKLGRVDHGGSACRGGSGVLHEWRTSHGCADLGPRGCVFYQWRRGHGRADLRTVGGLLPEWRFGDGRIHECDPGAGLRHELDRSHERGLDG